MRIREVVDALSTLSKATSRRDAIERFFNPWGVQQRIKKDRRPLPELIEELNKKVVDAAKKVQQQLQTVLNGLLYYQPVLNSLPLWMRLPL